MIFAVPIQKSLAVVAGDRTGAGARRDLACCHVCHFQSTNIAACRPAPGINISHTGHGIIEIIS